MIITLLNQLLFKAIDLHDSSVNKYKFSPKKFFLIASIANKDIKKSPNPTNLIINIFFFTYYLLVQT